MFTKRLKTLVNEVAFDMGLEGATVVQALRTEPGQHHFAITIPIGTLFQDISSLRSARRLPELDAIPFRICNPSDPAILIFAALRNDFNAGTPIADIIRKLGVHENTFYLWKQEDGGLGTPEIRELRQLRCCYTTAPPEAPTSRRSR